MGKYGEEKMQDGRMGGYNSLVPPLDPPHGAPILGHVKEALW